MAADRTGVMRDGPAQSPQGLNMTKPRPGGIVRVNLWASALATLAVSVIVLTISLAVIVRKGAAATARQAEPAGRLEPALQAGELVAGGIPDGNLTARSAPKRQSPTMTEPGVLEAGAIGGAGASGAVSRTAADADDLKASQAMSLQTSRTRGESPDPEADRQRRRLEEHEAKLKQALEAGTTASGGTGSPQTPPAPALAPPNLLQSLQALAGQINAAGQPAGLTALREDEDQNRQLRKEQFIHDMESKTDRNMVNATRKAGFSPFEVKAGWLIPATMEQGINSDIPGKISARVTQNVMDTATGRHLLIPQGSLLLGSYDSLVAYGQDGLLVAWRRIIFPDASSVDLEGMGGVDQSGFAGFRDSVNNHYARIVGFGLITSLFGAAYQVSQTTRDSSPGAAATPSQTAGAGVAQQLSQLGIEIARKNLRVQPTIEIRPGYQFNVRVDKDLVFSRAYVSGNAR